MEAVRNVMCQRETQNPHPAYWFTVLKRTAPIFRAHAHAHATPKPKPTTTPLPLSQLYYKLKSFPSLVNPYI